MLKKKPMAKVEYMSNTIPKKKDEEKMGKDYYQILQLTRSANDSDIKSA